MDSSWPKRWVACVFLTGTLLTGSMFGGKVSVSQSSTAPSPYAESSLSVVHAGTLAVREVTTDEENIENKTDILIASVDQELTLTAEELATLAEKRRLAHQALQETQTGEEESQNLSRGGASKAEEIISKAQSLMGIPYVFGGTTTKGFDCSGFTQYVFKASGIELPRTSYSQYGIGTAVPKDQLQPGDLVFFATYDSGASHVGIYIGGGNFIHAADPGVKITSLGDSYYSKRYLGARRML